MDWYFYSCRSPKILLYDGQGFRLCHKRLSAGRFRWWPAGDQAPGRFLQSHQLHVLLSGGNPEKAGGAPLWRPVLRGE